MHESYEAAYEVMKKKLESPEQELAEDDRKQAQHPIKTMKLYGHGRQQMLFKELQEKGCSLEVMTVDEVAPLLCLNYTGIDGCKTVVQRLGLGSGSAAVAANATKIILDIGSGLGGPSMKIASLSGCLVMGVDLQADICACATDISRRCGMDSKVSYVSQNVMEMTGEDKFDGALSLLCILHVKLADRSSLFKRVHGLLKTGSFIHLEDFYLLDGKAPGERGCFTDEEKHLLTKEVFVQDALLPTKADYMAVLEACGFRGVQFEDQTDVWKEFVCSRHAIWVSQRDRHEKVHGKQTWEDLDRFYRAMVKLFDSGALGGVRIVAQVVKQ